MRETAPISADASSGTLTNHRGARARNAYARRAADARRRAVRGDYAMARQDDRERVPAIRSAERTGGIAAEPEQAVLPPEGEKLRRAFGADDAWSILPKSSRQRPVVANSSTRTACSGSRSSRRTCVYVSAVIESERCLTRAAISPMSRLRCQRLIQRWRRSCGDHIGVPDAFAGARDRSAQPLLGSRV